MELASLEEWQWQWQWQWLCGGRTGGDGKEDLWERLVGRKDAVLWLVGPTGWSW